MEKKKKTKAHNLLIILNRGQIKTRLYLRSSIGKLKQKTFKMGY